jgi:hypothetical protein
MDKSIRARRILMRRLGVVVPDDIVADVKAALDASSRPSSSIAPVKDITGKCFDAVMSYKTLNVI